MKKLHLILIIFTLFSCKKEESPTPDIHTSSNGMVICNEGNFNWANASLSYYDIGTGALSNNVFESANGEKLGDICQSATFINDKLYVVVNNSAKIEVLNMDNFEQITTITGFASPRYIQQVSASKAYVTDLYANKVWIVDMNDHTISGSIPLSGWTEEMVLKNDRVYITNLERKYLYVVDISSDQVVDSIEVGTEAGSLVMDNQGTIWCTRSGDANSGQSPALVSLVNDSISVYELPLASTPSKLVYNTEQQQLYFLNGAVSRFDITSKELTLNFIPANDRILYGLGMDDDRLYVSDVKDFVQPSTIYVYDVAGNQKSTFNVGINAGFFLKK